MILLNNVIRKPKIYLYTAIYSLIVWIGILCWTIYFAITQDHGYYFLGIVDFILILIFMYLCLLQINWKIEIHETKAYIRGVTRKTTICNINDLIVLHRKPNKKGTIKFYLVNKDKRLATITMFDSNLELLEKFKNEIEK